MYVQHYMTPSPVTIGPEQTVSEAIEILNKYRFRHIPVVGENKVLLGMLSDRDLRSARPSTVARSKERQNVETQVSNTPVSQLMSGDCLSLNKLSTLDRALLQLQSENVGALPVVNEERQVIGILSVMDLLKAYRSMFGLGEKGSALVAIKDNGDEEALSKIAKVMEGTNVTFTRLIRTKESENGEPMIYLRINTYNIRAVHKAIEAAGFTVHIPRP